MPAAKARSPKRAAGGARAPKLPPITVAKFEEISRRLEIVVEENTALFIAKGQAFKEQHREGSSRPLTPLEAADVGIALGEQTPDALAGLQESGLRAYDEPETREVLLAAGIGTARQIVAAFRQVVALIEMPQAEFEDLEDDTDRLDEKIDELAGTPLKRAELSDGRARTSRAMAHFAAAAGFDPGEAWSLPIKAVWQALTTAATELQDAPAFSQLTGSLASTPGPDATSDD